VKYYDALKGLMIEKLGVALDMTSELRRVVYRVEGQEQLYLMDVDVWEECIQVGSLVERSD
jgi:hypothetical protein